MLTNAQMKEGRFEAWAKNRKRYNRIANHLSNDGYIMVCTHTQSVIYKKKHFEAGMFQATKNGLWVARGKSWDDISYCLIKFSK